MMTPQAPLSRKEFRRMMAAIKRSNAPGKAERIAQAQAKRDRKNLKRSLAGRPLYVALYSEA
jgi:hypothetical protein